jgi:poly(A)-specific ribonuclease
VTSLNRFQKRLVHQLVETEYPSLTSIGSPDFIRIVKYDKEREDRIRREKINRVEKRLLELRGFRWVIEALTSGNLSQLTPQVFQPLVGVVEEEADGIAYWKKTIDQLKNKNGRIPLVGHNLFMDVVYLWQCFYGGLPEKVEEFADLLHEKFPLLIDTKYIFTHDCGDVNPVASLDDIAKACENITKPKISKLCQCISRDSADWASNGWKAHTI